MTRLAVLACAVGIGLCGCYRESLRPGQMHVVLLDIDTLRADRLGVYGAKPSPSPRIDAWARDAAVFEWAIASAPYTPPSQASIFTGMHPIRHGVWSRHESIPAGLDRLPTILGRLGYQTIGFTGGGYVSRAFGFAEGFDQFDDTGLELEPLALAAGEALTGRDTNRPVFLFVHTYHVHTPYDPDDEARRTWTTGLPPPTPGFEASAETMEAARRATWETPPRFLPAADLAYSRGLYDGEIAELDRWFDGFVSILDNAGLRADNTLVVLLSDHGEAFGEHGSLLHETLYLPVTRVPLLLTGPGVRAGRVGCAVELVDLLPTVIELVGAEPPRRPTIDGESLVGTLDNEPCRSFGLSQSGYFRDKPALLKDDFHLVYDRRLGRPELFRYRQDPLEINDLSAREPEVTEAMVRDLARVVGSLEARRVDAAASRIEPEVAERLRSLGYLN